MGYPSFAALLGGSLGWHFYPCPRCGKKGYYLVKNPDDNDHVYPYILRCRYCQLQNYLKEYPKGIQISYLRLGRRIF